VDLTVIEATAATEGAATPTPVVFVRTVFSSTIVGSMAATGAARLIAVCVLVPTLS